MTIETHVLRGNGRIPNSRLPLLIYRSAFETSPVEMEAMFRENEWPPDWHSSFGVYPRHHFHSDTHELIAVTRGTLVGRFGSVLRFTTFDWDMSVNMPAWSSVHGVCRFPRSILCSAPVDL
jgi:uncharacterized protein YjlB